MADGISDLALGRLYRGYAPDDISLDDTARGAALRRLFDEGAPAWPGIPLRIEAFVCHLAARAAPGPGGLPALTRGPDLYLACACTGRVRGAVEAFDRAQLGQVDTHLARLRPTPAFVDEVRQEVRDKLFVGKGGASPKIAEYDGKGALGSWVRVIALRVAFDLRRRDGTAAPEDDSAPDALAAGNPEADYQEEHYRRAFDEAIQGAVAMLDDEQRRLLRRHFADGRTLDELATEFGVHRATVARHLAAARATLRSEARRRLQAALRASDSELESLARMMRSRLDLSLPGLLRTG